MSESKFLDLLIKILLQQMSWHPYDYAAGIMFEKQNYIFKLNKNEKIELATFCYIFRGKNTVLAKIE